MERENCLEYIVNFARVSFYIMLCVRHNNTKLTFVRRNGHMRTLSKCTLPWSSVGVFNEKMLYDVGSYNIRRQPTR